VEDGIEEVSQDSQVEAPVTEAPVENSTETSTGTDNGGFNPAWTPIRDDLGLQFETIQPHLSKIDKAYHDHITKVNGQYAPWKELADNGATPEQVTQAFQMLQRLNENPQEIYGALGQYLEQQGLLPEVVQAAEEEELGEEYETEAERELAELRERFEQMEASQREQFERAQYEQIQAKADQEVEAEYSAFRKANPNMSDLDWREIQTRHYHAAVAAGERGKIPSLEEVGKQYFDFVAQIRQAPRPNDLAPRLPGAGGAAPAPATKQASEFSREESQDALAALLMQNK